MPQKDGSLKILIREYSLRDKPEVVNLWRKVFPNDPPWNEPDEIVQRKSRWQKDLFLIGEKDGVVVAVVLGGYDGFRGWVYHLAVAPEWQGRGIGRQMMAAIEQKLEKMGCPKINLQVRSSNRHVIEFYRHLGYVVEDHTSMGKLLIR